MARKGDGLYQRGKVWYLDCRINGARHVEKLGKGISRTVAGELANIARTKILRCEVGIGKKNKDCTFEEAKKKFLAWVETNKKPRTQRTYRQCLEYLETSFKGKKLSTLTTWTIERHKQDRVKAGVKVVINRELAVLKTLFNRCREWNLYEGPNPVSAVKYLHEPRQTLRFLEPEEESKLIEHAHEPLKSLIILGLNTGLRVGAEALTLRWEHIDLKRNLLTVGAAYAKSGQMRTVPLNSEAKGVLTKLCEGRKGEWVFCRKDGTSFNSIRHGFRLTCQRAKLKGVTPHTLRHTFASRLAMAGIDLRTIQELGGWKSLELIQRYAHLSPNHKAEAIERITGKNFTTSFTTVGKKEKVARLISA